MKNEILVFSIFLTLSCGMFAQEGANYKYVRVPEKFEDFKEENQYQINALTAFLLEKVGYDALYKESQPAGVDPCDILKAAVHNESGIFKSRLYLTLEDCNGNIVFKSEEGESREKEYKTSYHEALRNAFASVTQLQPKPATAIKTVVVDPVVTSEERAVKKEAPILENPKKSTETKISERTFSNGSDLFILKEVPSGYHLFKKGEEERVASLMRSSSGENYIYVSKNLQGNAFFDRDKNLVVEYIDPNTQLLSTVTYKAKD